MIDDAMALERAIKDAQDLGCGWVRTNSDGSLEPVDASEVYIQTKGPAMITDAMIEKALFEWFVPRDQWPFDFTDDEQSALRSDMRRVLEAVAPMIREAERERCAALCEDQDVGGCACNGHGCSCGNYDDAGWAGAAAQSRALAAAIRALDPGGKDGPVR